jgi:hypothetical protein
MGVESFRDEFLPNIERATVDYARWRKEQPAEYKAWVTYRDAVLAGEVQDPPKPNTRFGKALVAVAGLAERIEMANVTLTTSGGTTNLSGTVTVTAVAVPANKVVNVRFYVDSVLKATDTVAPYNYSWPTALFPDGAHELKAVALYDKNQVQEVKLNVTVSNVAVPPPPPPVQGPPVNTSVPLINGTATEGQTLAVSQGNWTNSPTSYTRNWLRCNASGTSCFMIAGATGVNYVLTAADVGSTIRCAVTAHNSFGPSAVVQTAQTDVVAALAPAVPVLVNAPLLTGQPTLTFTLATSNGSWTNNPTSYTYQWKRCNPALFTAGETAVLLETSVSSGFIFAQPVTLTQTGTIESLSFYVSAVSGALRLGLYNNSAGYPSTQKAVTAEFTPSLGWNTVNVVTPVSCTAGTYWLVFTPSSASFSPRKSTSQNPPDSKFIAFTYAALPASFPASATSSFSHYSFYGNFSISETCADITDATNQSYLLVTADVGSTVKAAVTAVNATGSSTAALTAASGVVAGVAPPPPPPPEPPPPPPPSGTIVAPANLANVQASAVAGAVYTLQGSFGNQTFTQNKKITFVGAPGATLGSVTFTPGAGNIELSGLRAGVVTVGQTAVAIGGTYPAPAVDIVLRNIDGDRFNIFYGHRIRIYGGDWGTTSTHQGSCLVTMPNLYSGSAVPTDVLIDGAYVHDFGMISWSGGHSEGIQTWAVNGLVIRNCIFERCGGTGTLTLEYAYDASGGNTTPYAYPPALFPPVGNIKVYNNISRDTPGEFPYPSPYFAYYDVQAAQDIPGLDWTQLNAGGNVWPRGVFDSMNIGQVVGAVPPRTVVPPPNWPPA